MKKENSIFNIHIGSIIRNKVAEKGVLEKQLAQMIERHYTDIPDIFKRKSINTDLLLQISVALDYDFFKEVYTFYLDSILQNKQTENSITIVLDDKKVSVKHKTGITKITEYHKNHTKIDTN
jgi:hypothetical protein